MKKEISLTKGDKEGLIDDLIAFLNEAKRDGATHYEMTWSHDPNWAFKWFRAYRLMSEKEIVEAEIDELQKKIDAAKRKLSTHAS